MDLGGLVLGGVKPEVSGFRMEFNNLAPKISLLCGLLHALLQLQHQLQPQQRGQQCGQVQAPQAQAQVLPLVEDRVRGDVLHGALVWGYGTSVVSRIDHSRATLVCGSRKTRVAVGYVEIHEYGF